MTVWSGLWLVVIAVALLLWIAHPTEGPYVPRRPPRNPIPPSLRAPVVAAYTVRCLYCERTRTAGVARCEGCGATEAERVPPTRTPVPTGGRKMHA